MNRHDAMGIKFATESMEDAEWTKADLQRRIIPAEVFARLNEREISVVLFPGAGLADHTPRSLPIDCVPADMRTPNTRIWIRFDESQQPIEVRRRQD